MPRPPRPSSISSVSYAGIPLPVACPLASGGGQAVFDGVLDPTRPGRHGCYAVTQDKRLVDSVGGERHGLGGRLAVWAAQLAICDTDGSERSDVRLGFFLLILLFHKIACTSRLQIAY
jgi:hypothetical protein